MRVIFFGTPNFAASVLEYLLEHGVNIVAVVSKPDKPKGRSGQPVPTPVKETLLKLAPTIPLYQPEKVSVEPFPSILSNHQADLFVVVAYGEIIKENLLTMPRKGAINLHASLLPKYRGAAPIQQVLIDGEKESGVSIMYMVKKMDAGDVIATASTPIGPDMTFGELEEKLCEIGKPLLLDVIKRLENGEVNRTAQNHDLATFCPKIELEDCEIHWDRSAESIHNLIRGVNPEPTAWCYVNVKGEKKRLRIFKSKIGFQEPLKCAAAQKNAQGDLMIGTATSTLLIEELQLEGKKRMTGRAFLNGISITDLSFYI